MSVRYYDIETLVHMGKKIQVMSVQSIRYPVMKFYEPTTMKK